VFVAAIGGVETTPPIECRAGHIFPLLLFVREQAATDGPPSFIGILRTLATSQQHLVLQENFTISAASQGSLVMLNIEPSMLKSGGLNIKDWVEEWTVGAPMQHSR
jgi:hypothetical protein